MLQRERAEKQTKNCSLEHCFLAFICDILLLMKMKRLLIFVALLLFGILTWKGAVALFSEERQLVFGDENPIMLKDDGLLYQINSDAKSVGEFIEKHKIVLSENDLVYPNENEKVLPGMIVEIWRGRKIEIEVDGKIIKESTFAQTVEKALMAAGVELGRLDKVKPARAEMLGEEEKIAVTRINVENISVTKEIEFETIEKNDDKLQWRKKVVEQEGEKGEKVIQYKITYQNGKEVSKEVISSETVKKPVAEIVTIGTKIKVGKVKTGIASWYRFTGKLTCASRIFPRGTWLRVTNNENGKQVIVEVRDFGPELSTGRRIDLEAVAFEKIAPLGKGLVNVKVEEILQ